MKWENDSETNNIKEEDKFMKEHEKNKSQKTQPLEIFAENKQSSRIHACIINRVSRKPPFLAQKATRRSHIRPPRTNYMAKRAQH